MYPVSLKEYMDGKRRRIEQKKEHIAEEKRGEPLVSLKTDFKLAVLPENDPKTRNPGDFGTPEDKTVCLNAVEKKAYESAIHEFMKEEGTEEVDKAVLRKTVMEFIFDPLAFKDHYVQWKADYTNIPRLKRDFPTLEDYVVDRSKAFVRARRNEIVAARVRLFQTKSVDAPLDPAEEDKVKKTTDKVVTFLDRHRDELLEYSTLPSDDPQRGINGKYFQMFIDENYLPESMKWSLDQKQQAFQLFQDVVGDLCAAVTAENKLDLDTPDMVDKTQYAIDNDINVEGDDWQKEWDKMLKDNEEKYLKEKPPEQKTVQVYKPADTGKELPRNAVLDSPQRVALYAGLYYEGDNGDGSHNVKFLDSDLRTTLRIRKNPNSTTYDDAQFIIEDPYADPSKNKEIVLSKENLRGGCNLMYLDYIMNDWIRVNKLTPNVDVNSILNDRILQKMAEHFFGKNLNEITLTPEKRAGFQRFLQVLMNGDPSTTADSVDENYPTFKERVDVMSRVLDSGTYSGVIEKECDKESVTMFTVSTLLKAIGYSDKK